MDPTTERATLSLHRKPDSPRPELGPLQPAPHRNRVASPARERGAGYMAAHWRGEQGLVQSFWINNTLLWIPLSMGISGLMAWINAKGGSLQANSIAVLVGWPLTLLISIWCIVGAWRSAGRYLHDGGALLWGQLARLSLALGMLQTLASACFGFLPQAGDYLKMARGIDPIGHASFELSPDGRTLKLSGPIGLGDGTRLQRLLNGSPQPLRLVELASPGGRLYEAERMVALVRKAGANTRAVGGCESACTLVFLAGTQRQLMPGARLGFHRASTGTYNPMLDEMANQHLASSYRGLDLPEYFVERTARTPAHGMWYPRSEELLSHALIAAPLYSLDVLLPEGQAPLAADYAEALRANPAWYQLELRLPGLLERASARMAALPPRPGGSDAAEAVEDWQQQRQLAALQVLAPELLPLILGSAPALRRQYLGVLKAQLQTARAAGSESCRALLAGQLSRHRQLPDELLAKESAWLISAAAAEPPRWLARPPSAVELEVVRRTVGAQAPGLLSRLWSDGTPSPATGSCDQAIRILDAAARLPVAQRELVERVMFQDRAI